MGAWVPGAEGRAWLRASKSTEVGTRDTLVLAKQKGPGWRPQLAAHLSGDRLVPTTRVSPVLPRGRWATPPFEFSEPREPL